MGMNAGRFQMSEDFQKLTEVFGKLTKDFGLLTEVFLNLTEPLKQMTKPIVKVDRTTSVNCPNPFFSIGKLSEESR